MVFRLRGEEIAFTSRGIPLADLNGAQARMAFSLQLYHFKAQADRIVKPMARNAAPFFEEPLMNTRTLKNVKEILLPFSGELPLSPSVHIDDPISKAIEVMVRHNLRILPVFRDKRPVGQVRLQDAFAIVGIEMP
jgi:CBS domain-containing protein